MTNECDTRKDLPVGVVRPTPPDPISWEEYLEQLRNEDAPLPPDPPSAPPGDDSDI